MGCPRKSALKADTSVITTLNLHALSYFVGFNLEKASHEVFQRSREVVRKSIGTIKHEGMQFRKALAGEWQFAREEHVQTNTSAKARIVWKIK